jgi:hypothetical protein
MADSSSDDKGRNCEAADDKPTIEPTIVGGRPLAKSRSLQGIPRGIEVLIKKASVDSEFRSVLLERRAVAAADIDLELSAAECALLNAIPVAQIEKIIENAKVPDEHRRLFLGKVAAAMLAVLGIPLFARAWESGRKRVQWDLWQSPYHPRGGTPLDGFPTPEEAQKLLYKRNVIFIPGEKWLKRNGKWLGWAIVGEASNWINISVNYRCPFKTAEIEIFFRNRQKWPKAHIPYDPSLSFVYWGKGEVTFCATGKGPKTDQIILALRSREHENRLPQDPITPGWPPDDFLPGEYLVDGRVIWKIVKHSKTWSAE